MQDFLPANPETRQAERFFGRAKWWVEHEGKLRHVGLWIWVAADVVLLVFALWIFTDAFLIRYETERTLVRGLAIENADDLHENTKRLAAKPLRPLGEPAVLAAKEGYADIFSFIENPNARWWAEVEYQYVSGEAVLGEAGMAIVYPLEQAPILALAVPRDRSLVNPTLRLTRVVWHAIDPHDISDFDAWKGERAAFMLEDASFVPAAFEGSDIPIGRSRFTIKNVSAYGYWEVPTVVFLRRGEAVVGVTKTMITNFEAGESRMVELSWFGAYPSVTRVDVVTSPEIFDSSAYLPPSFSP